MDNHAASPVAWMLPLVKKQNGVEKRGDSRDKTGALSGVSMKAGYQRSTPAFQTSHHRLLFSL